MKVVSLQIGSFYKTKSGKIAHITGSADYKNSKVWVGRVFEETNGGLHFQSDSAFGDHEVWSSDCSAVGNYPRDKGNDIVDEYKILEPQKLTNCKTITYLKSMSTFQLFEEHLKRGRPVQFLTNNGSGFRISDGTFKSTRVVTDEYGVREWLIDRLKK